MYKFPFGITNEAPCLGTNASIIGDSNALENMSATSILTHDIAIMLAIFPIPLIIPPSEKFPLGSI